MINSHRFVLALIVVLFASAAAFAQRPVPITLLTTATGIEVKVETFGRRIPADATVTFDVLRRSWQTGEEYRDLATGKTFERCKQGGLNNCVRKDGTVLATPEALPRCEDYTTICTYSILPGAKGFNSYIWEASRVQYQMGWSTVVAPTVYLHEGGAKMDVPQAYWVDDKVFVAGVFVNNKWYNGGKIVDFAFTDSGINRREKRLASIRLGKTHEMGPEWTLIWEEFVVSPDYQTGGGNASICFEVTLSEPQLQRWIVETSEKHCFPARNSASPQ